jgi:predicted phosphodiesterase
MSNSIYIIHLSDLHINPNNPGEVVLMYKRLCQKIEEFKEEKGKFSLLVISGDLVNKGAGNYQLVGKIIDNICTDSGLTREQVFLVPGNHDVVQNKCPGYVYKTVIQGLKQDPKNGFKELDEKAKRNFTPGFKAYSEFAKNFLLNKSQNFALPGFAQADIEISDVPIRLCGLNTALVAGPEDNGKDERDLKNRVLGLQILWDMLGGDDRRLKIVVSHYPLSWIHEMEREEVIGSLKESNAIFLHGHTHILKVDTMGGMKYHELLILGVGSLLGKRWQGRNHCQILELSSDNSSPLLHEWLWSGEYGWRGFEPLEINWSGWEPFRKKLLPSSPPLIHESGLVSIGKGRTIEERNSYWSKAIESAAENTYLIILGRSLIDFSLLDKNIERSINEKKLHVKIGLLDENSLQNKKLIPNYKNNPSWIEKPIPGDWAMDDVPRSMARFKEIKVNPGTGSLEIYGLSFYLSHSFLAYTDKEDNHRYCLEEAGMALHEIQRPFIELKAVSKDSYASSLESLYASLMTDDRLLLSNYGQPIENDTTQRAKIIAHKAERLGLVDLSVGRNGVDWDAGRISEYIDNTPVDGEIFIVGRTLVSWTNYLDLLAVAITQRHVKCTFVIADPCDPKLQSLVEGDYAKEHLISCMDQFYKNLYPKLKNESGGPTGLFELYGIPTYVPDTFASYTGPDQVRFCTLEPGIGVDPNERPILYFKNVSENDIYTRLNKIYRGILKGRTALLRFPNSQ